MVWHRRHIVQRLLGLTGHFGSKALCRSHFFVFVVSQFMSKKTIAVILTAGWLLRFEHSAESSCVRVYCIGCSVPPLNSAQEQNCESPKHEVRELRRHGHGTSLKLSKHEVWQRNGADQQVCRLRMLPLPVMRSSGSLDTQIQKDTRPSHWDD